MVESASSTSLDAQTWNLEVRQALTAHRSGNEDLVGTDKLLSMKLMVIPARAGDH